MSIQTDWGYIVDTSATELPPLISVADFRIVAPSLSATDDQIAEVLGSVSAIVRNYCGWHVSPALYCEYTGTGDGTLLMLPAMGVRDVSSLILAGTEKDGGYEWTAAGMVRLVDGTVFPECWRSAVCSYYAGFDSAAIGQIAAQIAANALVASPGVREEHAGQVGITYNQTGSGISGGVSLLQRDMDALAQYRLARAW